jgi:hypothetical protein
MFGLNKNHYLGVIVLALLSLGQLQRITTPLVSFYLHDVVALFWLIDLCRTHATFLFHKTKTILTQNKALALFLFGSATWILLGWNWQWYSAGFSFWPFAYSLRMLVYGALAYSLLQINTAKKILSHHDIGYGLEFFYAVLLLFGWLQYFFIPDTRWLAVLGWDDHLGRMIGTQFDPNFLGLLLIFASIWTVYQFQQTRHARFLVTSLLVVAAITVTWSRSTYIAFVVTHVALVATNASRVFATFFKPNKKINLTLPIISLLLITVLLIGIQSITKPVGEGGNLGRISTVQSRIANTLIVITPRSSVETILGRGLFTITTDTYQNNYQRPNHSKLPTSLPAFIISGIGYGGLFALLAVTFYVVFKTKHKQQRIQSLLKRYPMFVFAVLATLIHSLANASFTQPFVVLLLLSFLVLENSEGKCSVKSSKKK